MSMMVTVHRINPEEVVTSDLGTGAVVPSNWFMLKWVEPIASQHITVKELAPIVLAAAIWGRRWEGQTVLVMCDNKAVVNIVNQVSSSNREAMHLIRCCQPNELFNSHLKGVDDALSRNRLDHCFMSFPQAEPTPLPEALLDLLILEKPDWTSRRWTEPWTAIYRTA